jgi:hypothetical protein
MKYAAAFMIAIALAGCQTVRSFVKTRPDYSELPAEAMRELALEIEQAVQSGNRQATIADRGGIVVSTEGITQAIHTRIVRSTLVNAFRETGHAAEQPNGLVTILRTAEYKKSTTRKERDRNALLIMSENMDRWALYEGVLKASNLSPKALPAIQEIFYRARLESMPENQKYEDESGNIMRKENPPPAG